MKIVIELPDTVLTCKSHSFDGQTGYCECGLHINLLNWINDADTV